MRESERASVGRRLSYMPAGPMNTESYGANYEAWSRRALAMLARPAEQPTTWSATVALMTAIAERAEVIYARASEDHLPAFVDEGTAVDGVCAVAEHLYRAALEDPNALDDETWSRLPGWWQTRIVQSWRDQTTDDHAWSRLAETLEHTAAVPRGKDGAVRRNRRRVNMRTGGRSDRTADGADLPDAMVPYGVIAQGTAETAGTAQAAYEAHRLMADAGLIPRLLGTDDKMRPEMTPRDLYGARIESVSEGPRGIYWNRVRRVQRQGDHAFTITERTGTERVRRHAFHAFTYGPAVLRSDRGRSEARRASHNGHGAALVVGGDRVRVTYVRRERSDVKVSRTVDYSKPRGERWIEHRDHDKRRARSEHRAAIVAELASLTAQDEGTERDVRGYVVTLAKKASAASKRAAVLVIIDPRTGTEERVTPRRAASLIAASA